MTDILKHDLHQAWELRHTQQLEAAEHIYKKLYTQTHPDLEGLSTSAEWHLELKLLEASLLRGRQRIEDSEERLLKVKSEIENKNLKIPFHYYFQRGLNLFYKGYFPSALEFFARAQELAENAEQKSMAIGNQFLCLDNLNLSTHSAVKNLKALQSSLSEKYFSQAILPQLETFERRQAFRQGDIVRVFVPLIKDIHQSSSLNSTQAHYVQLWVSHLPYIHCQDMQPEVVPLIKSPHLLWKQYRLRTLLLDARYNDEGSIKISERVDRLYLWLWKWMVSPSSLPPSALEESWQDLDPCEICSQTTAEDFVLLRLCLRWTRLFDSHWEIPSEEWLKKSTPPHIQMPPLFQYESLLLDYLEALQKKNRVGAHTSLMELQAHSFYSHPFLHFRELIQGVSGQRESSDQSSNPLFIFGKRWVKYFKNETTVTRASSNMLIINLHNFHWQYGKNEGVSKPLCLLLKILHEKGHLSFHDLMKNCFSIPTYCEDLHRSKIMNLLTRVRKVLPNDFKLFTRDQWIYSKGLITKIRFESRECERVQWKLPRIFERPCLEQNKHHMDRWIQPSLVIKKLKGKEQVTRQELQDFLKISKATTNRLLVRWQNEGFLIKQSSGRSIFYIINRTYFFRLKSQDS